MSSDIEDTFERFQIDRIYQKSSDVASYLRRIADDIDRAVESARRNEGTTENFRTTYVDLPHEVVNLVSQGIANAQLDSPGRQLRELILAREASQALAD
jgi:hypothetical protein